MKQKTLFKVSDYASDFGGSLLQTGTRKTRRPLSSQNPLKIVLKADATKTVSLRTFSKAILRYFDKFETKFKVKMYEKAVVGDHIHFVARFPSRLEYRRFIKALTGSMSRTLKIKWKFRPWSRILIGGNL